MAVLRFDLDASVMKVDNSSNESQPQAASGCSRSQLNAESESPINLIRMNADSVVLDLEKPLPFPGPCGDDDSARPTRSEEFEGVVDQLKKDPGQ